MEMIIGGRKIPSSDGKRIQVKNPATGELVDSVPAATAEDVGKAVEAAGKGFSVWASTRLHERARILIEFARRAESKREELGGLLCREMGKIVRETEAEIDSLVKTFTGYAEKAKHLYGAVYPTTAEKGVDEDFHYTVREPLGVVACIVPFNYPAELFAHKVAPALIMGNAVIVKPPSSNPLTCIKLVELLHECGVPGDAANIITGSGAVAGEYLAGHPGVSAISFTGSTEVGIRISKIAAGNMTRVFLECGGNDPIIIFEDTDLALSVEEAAVGRAYNTGQTCCATKRIIVQNGIKDEFVKRLMARLSAIKTGDPSDRGTGIGCLISEKAAVEVAEQVEKTVKQGARRVFGGARKGSFFEPTILDGVTPDMDIAKDMEVFGPVFPIIGFDTEDDAVRIANNTVYGLQGGVMTSDVYKAMRVASRLQCGTIVINGSGNYRSAEMPFGGYKKSGIGREGLYQTLDEFSQPKTIVLKRALSWK